MNEKEELERLEYRYLHTRAARSASRKGAAVKPAAPAPAPAKPDEKPEIHVHVALPEVKDAPKCETPRKWKFTHRYDQYNKLIETTATAE